MVNPSQVLTLDPDFLEAYQPEDAPTSKDWVNARVQMTDQKAAFLVPLDTCSPT